MDHDSPHKIGTPDLRVTDEDRISETECDIAPVRETIVKTAVDPRAAQKKDRVNDSFWDLDAGPKKNYTPAAFSHDSLTTRSVDSDAPSTSPIGSEKIPPREAFSKKQPKVVETIGGSRIAIGSYHRRSPHHTGRGAAHPRPSESKQESILCETYDRSSSPLLRRILVLKRDNLTEFYGRFRTDAVRSHRTRPTEQPTEIEPFFSFIPQYAHMNRAQLESYYYLRECIRNKTYPKCDLTYLQLYIFEIINLPDEIPPTEGIELLSDLWLAYRAAHPRLDGYLCEWLPDYCMLHDLPLPEKLFPLVPSVTPKAQFKEFFFDAVLESRSDIAADALIETSSDYDYRTSRYYAANREIYDKLIPASIAALIEASRRAEHGIFTTDKTYRIHRECYSGAVISSDIKRTLDIEFYSFTKCADSRQTVTKWVKYSENKVRELVGVKAKLSAPVSDTDLAELEKFFAPYVPRSRRREKEDEFMPADYAKLYESETKGFDFASAEEIESSSWTNTTRLTGEEYTKSDESPAVTNAANDLPETTKEKPIGVTDPSINEEKSASTVRGEGSLLIEGVTHALCGDFSKFCHARGVFDGDLADRINTLFLDILGDVILEIDEESEHYQLIEDYREDVESWLNHTK